MSRIRALGLLTLALTVTYCGGGGGGSSPSEPPPGGGPQVIVVQVRDNTYEPRTVTISPGDTVRWVFSGPSTTHTVTARDGSFDSGAIFTGPGTSFERRFNTAGTYEYSCQAHSVCCLMRGSIRVGSNAPPPDPTYE
jgi:plastocyanin